MRNRRLDALVLVVALLLAAPLHAATLDEALEGFPLPFDGFTSEKFKPIPSTPDLPEAYSASFDVPALGPVTAYVYDLTRSPKIALTLSKVDLLGLADLIEAAGVEISSPVVFWVKQDGVLDAAAMPADLRTYVTQGTGLTPTARAMKGVNLFGRFKSTTLLEPLNLPEVCLGFASREEAPEVKTTVVTMVVPPDATWRNPFHLPNTTVKRGVVIIKRTSGSTPKTDVESWATAALTGASHDFTMYANHDGRRLTNVGFDTASASLNDIVAVFGALGESLSLPSLPSPPEKAIQLANERAQTYAENERPDFSKMMFQASLSDTLNASVNVNASGKVFDISVAEVELHASAKGIYVSVPAACPLRPVGLKADLTKMSVTSIPVTAELKDCFLGAIAETVAVAVSDTAENAALLAETAASDVSSYTAKRAEAWGNAIAQTAAAQTAIEESSKVVALLDGEVTKLWSDIGDLEDDISDLLKKIWGSVSGEVKSLRAEKSRKVSERNRKRAKLAKARQMEAQARDSASAMTGATFVAELVEINEKLLAATADQWVQDRVKDYSKTITAEQIEAEANLLFASGKLTLAEGVQPEAITAQAFASLIDKQTETLMRTAVANLPTMAYDVPVKIVANDLCLYVDDETRGLLGGRLKASRCGNYRTGSDGFLFRTDGRLASVYSKDRCFGGMSVTTPCDDPDHVGMVFFDEFTGQIRSLIKGRDEMTRPMCLNIPSFWNLTWSACDTAVTSFTLQRVESGSGIKALAAVPVAADAAAGGLAERTNLAPLSLPPLEP